MNLFALSGLLTGISSLVFGIYVYLKNRRNKANKLFAIFTFAVAVWGFGGWKIGLIPYGEADLALLWWRITHIGVIFIPIFFLHFVYQWLEIKEKLIIFFSYFQGIFFLGLNLYDLLINIKPSTGLFINEMSWLFNSFYWDTHYHFDFYWPYFFLWLSGVLYAHYKLFKFYGKSSGTKQIQIKYFLIAFAVSYAGGSTCYLSCFNVNLYPVFNLAIPFYPALMAYAIVAHRFMDIKMVMRRYSVFLAALSTVLILATAVKYLLATYFYNYSVWGDPLILIAALFIFPPIRNRFYRLANQYFFSSLYDSGEVIASLSDKLRTTIETEKIYDFIYQTLINAFHIKAFGLLIYNDADKNYLVEYNNGFVLNKQKVFSEDKELNEMFIKQNKLVITEDVRRLSQFDDNQTVALLKKIGVEILAPLNVKNKTIGLIALGKKESGDMYNDEDLKVLEVVGAQAAISLENALLYKETKDFSIKLEKEVERATRDLKKANVQLKKLDAAKSEFISIASHQLRTPLTVIKGYISMMLEGNFGQLTDSEKESLEKVFESNERLIQLVENLLNISRIESGRLQFNFEEVDFSKMVASVVEELSGYVKKKNLRLEYKPPAKPLPLVKLDEEKIRQVVMNLVDNAIKYTKQGGITVRVEQSRENITFCVSDTGMGISEADLANLFKKFSRGKGTSLVHTEGTGLGLYVARIMIESHQGRIWAESAGEGKGSKFCFALPVK